MRAPMTISVAANAATGTQEISEPSIRKAASASTPSITAEREVCAPLEMFISVAPIVPEPGMPPSSAAATLALPCATSSRLELCRVRVRVSITRQVLSVSIESSAASVSAGTPTCTSSCMPMLPAARQRSPNAPSKLPPLPPSGPMTNALPSSTSRRASTRPSAK